MLLSLGTDAGLAARVAPVDALPSVLLAFVFLALLAFLHGRALDLRHLLVLSVVGVGAVGVALAVRVAREIDMDQRIRRCRPGRGCGVVGTGSENTDGEKGKNEDAFQGFSGG